MSSEKADGPQLKYDEYQINPLGTHTNPPLPLLPEYWNRKGTHSVSKANCTLANAM